MDNFIYSDKNDFMIYNLGNCYPDSFYFFPIFLLKIQKYEYIFFYFLNYISSDNKSLALESLKKSLPNSKFLNYNLEVFQFGII